MPPKIEGLLKKLGGYEWQGSFNQSSLNNWVIIQKMYDKK